MFGASSVWEEALTSSFMSSHSSGCAVGPTERERESMWAQGFGHSELAALYAPCLEGPSIWL